MRTWEEFWPDVIPSVGTCPQFTITRYLQLAAADFLRQSYVWRAELGYEITIPGESHYKLPIPEGARVEDMLYLALDEFQITRTFEPRFNNFQLRSRPTLYSLENDTDVVFYPTPDAKYSIRGSCILTTSRDAEGVEDFIYETHGITIAHGAIARLLMLPQKDWTDFALGEEMQRQYMDGVDAARTRNHRRANTRVQMMPFGESSQWRS